MLDTSKLTQTALCGAHWLVVDPDPVRARTTAFALMEAGALVTTISSIRAATEWLDTQEQPLDGVAVDVEVCRRNEGFVSSLRWRESPCFALALSETADQRAIREMVRSTAIEFLFGNDGLANLVAAATRVTIVTRRMRDPAAFARSSEVPAPPPPSTLPHKALEAAGLGYDVDATVDAWGEELGLTEREATVLRHIVRGCVYRDIAAKLGISTRTVKMHASNVRRKAGISTRSQLIQRIFQA
jgi:DNA-binding NarL/FixJ family response regulator